MTLRDIIDEFLNEDYSFFKYRDKDGNDIMVSFKFDSHHEFFGKYMSYYKNRPSLSSLLEDATLGVIELPHSNNKVYYVRHPHQEVFTDYDGNTRGIPNDIAQAVAQRLKDQIDRLEKCTYFSQLIKIVEECRVSGFGELSIYDTAVRIGAFLGIAPDRVYLHAGTRVGIEALEKKGYLVEGSSKKKSISVKELPHEFKGLSADEIQHFACSKKESLKNKLDVRTSLFKINNPYCSENAAESANLFIEYQEVSVVAEKRGMAESTIYKHLFQSGVIDPFDLLPRDKFNRCREIIGKEEYKEELNALFANGGQSAYYYIRDKVLK